jgi:hypothetical protein
VTRTGGIDEAGGDQVDPDRRDLDREVGDKGGHRGGGRRDERQAGPPAAVGGAAHEQQRAAGPHPPGGKPGHLDGQPLVIVEGAVRPLAVQLGQGRVVRAGPGPVTITWSTGAGSPAKNRSSAAGSVASKAAVPRAPTSAAACLSRSGRRAARTTSAPSARARRAVSSPMPALPPMMTTVWPSSSGSRRVTAVLGAVVMTVLR